MYNYCIKKPYSFMTIDARSTATIPFKKLIELNELIEYRKNINKCIK